MIRVVNGFVFFALSSLQGTRLSAAVRKTSNFDKSLVTAPNTVKIFKDRTAWRIELYLKVLN